VKLVCNASDVYMRIVRTRFKACKNITLNTAIACPAALTPVKKCSAGCSSSQACCGGFCCSKSVKCCGGECCASTTFSCLPYVLDTSGASRCCPSAAKCVVGGKTVCCGPGTHCVGGTKCMP
jgi:hypothetical protein